MSRSTKLNKKVQNAVVTALRAGNFASTAAAYAGITERTYYRWMERGEKDKSGIYRTFYRAVRQASCHAEVRAVAIIQNAMPDDWVAAMTYLERRHPERWSRNRGVRRQEEPESHTTLKTNEIIRSVDDAMLEVLVQLAEATQKDIPPEAPRLRPRNSGAAG